MMKLFTVYDSKAETFIPPFCHKTSAEALRAFNTVLNDEGSHYCRHPADFTLMELGFFNDLTGKIEISATMENLGNGLHVKGKKSEN